MTTHENPSRIYLPDDPRNIDFNGFDARVQVMQIIVAALAMGVVFFVAIGLMNLKGLAGQLDTLNWLGLGVALVAILLSVIVPSVISKAASPTQLAQQATDSSSPSYEQQVGLYQVRLIVGCALLEGAAFLNAIVFQSAAHPLSLVALVVCVALILARFPTKRRIQNWLAARDVGS